VVAVRESSVSTDLNGDGDQIDDVANVFDGVLLNLRMAVIGPSMSGPAFETGPLPGETFAITDERSQGVDLNGDNDQLDFYRVVIRRKLVAPSPPPPSTTSATSSPRTPTAAVGSVQPARLLDTRINIGYVGTKPSAGQVIVLKVAGRGGVPSGGIGAVTLNVTMTDATASGYVTVWGGGAQPATSNLNVAEPGQTIPNLVLSPVDSDGNVRLFTSGGGHVIADLVAWFGGEGAYEASAPTRLLDTRNDVKPPPGSTVSVDLARSAGMSARAGQLVVLNVTAVDATDGGYLTVWGAGGQPGTSNVNVSGPGQTIPNLVIVPLGTDEKIRVFTSAGAHVVVDMFGTLSGPQVTARGPLRVLVTRSGGQVGYTGNQPGSGQVIELAIGKPGDIEIVNLTATNTSSAGFVTVWPSGPRPDASNLNPEHAGQSIANLVFVPVGADGKIRIFTSAGTDLVADSFGTIRV
jgi:hypothetical protein